MGGPPDGTFKNLGTGATEKRSNGGNIEDENISKDSNVPGTLSMANTGQKNSGGSQFFLNVANNANLDCSRAVPPSPPSSARWSRAWTLPPRYRRSRPCATTRSSPSRCSRSPSRASRPRTTCRGELEASCRSEALTSCRVKYTWVPYRPREEGLEACLDRDGPRG